MPELNMESGGEWLDSLQRRRTASDLSWNTAIVLSVLLGYVGADRFYARRFGLGLAKLFTLGGYFVWWVIDILLLLQGRMKDDFGREIRRRGSM